MWTEKDAAIGITNHVSRKLPEGTPTVWPAVTCVLLSIAAYAVFLPHGLAPAVVGYNLVSAERVLNGEVPYRDFLYNYTPGVLWLNALLFKLLGTTLMTARIGVFAAKALTALLLFMLARRFLRGWLAVLPVIMTLAWIGYADILKVFPTQYGMLFLLASCLAVLKSHDIVNGKPKLSWLVAAGALAAFTFLFKQNVGVFTLAAAGASVVCAGLLTPSTKEGLSRHVQSVWNVLAVTAGFVLAVAPALLYLASNSALGEMVSHFTRHAAEYGEAKGIALPSPLLLLPFGLVAGIFIIVIVRLIGRRAVKAVRWVTVGGCVALLFVIVWGESPPTAFLYRSVVAQAFYLPAYVAFAGLTWFAIAVRSKGKSEEQVRPQFHFSASLVTLVLFALAAFLEIFPRSDADHLVRMLPSSLLAAVALLTGPSPRSGVAWRLSPTLVVAFVLLTALGLRVTWAPQFDRGLHFKEGYPLEFERGRGVSGSPNEAARMNRVVAFVQANTRPSDRILAIARKMTSVYFFAERPNTTRVLWFDSAGIPDDERNKVVDAIRSQAFRLVLVGSGLNEDDLSADNQAALKAVGESYEIAEVIDRVVFFVPRK